MKKHFTYRLFISFFILFSGIHMYAESITFELEGIDYTVISENEVKCKKSYYCPSSNSIKIPDIVTYKGIAYTVTKIAKRGFSNCQSLKSVFIPHTVTSIEEEAFYRCDSLTNVHLPDSLTYIGNEAFFYCELLTNIYLPKSIMHIGDMAFYKSGIQDTLHIPANTIHIGERAFSSCYNLKHIVVERNNPVYTSEKGMLFNKEQTILYSCPAAKSEDFELPKTLEQIGSAAFSGCKQLKEITIPENINTVGASAFYDCQSLESISLPKQINEIAEFIFYNCIDLTEIYIPKGVRIIGEKSFSHCKSLEHITLPEGIQDIGICAFDGCTSLASITLPPNISRIKSGTFMNCTNLTGIEIPENIRCIDSGAFRRCINLRSISFPTGIDTINYDAFKDCLSLTNIEIPNNISYLSVRAFNNTAWYNSKPTGVVCLGKILYKYKGTIIEEHFEIEEDVEVIGEDAFAYQPIIKSIKFPETVKKIDIRAFYECKNLEKVYLPDSLIEIGSAAFGSCKKIKKIKIPASVKKIGYNTLIQTNLKAFEVAKENSVYSSKNGVLFNKDKTAIISFPYEKKKKYYKIPPEVIEVSDFAFYECNNLKNVTLPFGLIKVGREAFKCRNISSYSIPETVKSINRYAFAIYISIRIDVYWKNPDEVKVSSNSFHYATFEKEDNSLYVPQGTAHLYQKGDAWKKFNIIEREN